MDATPTVVFRSRAQKPCRDHALVLRALGIPHQVVHEGQSFALIVPADHHATAARELDLYEEENEDWPPPADRPPVLTTGKLGAALYALLMLALFPIGQRGLFGLNFWESGMMDAGQVLAGEWWRTITALSLHSSLQHVAGNIVFGSLFAVLAGHSLGLGLTWSGALAAGALGNWTNALLQGAEHRSIGASTAVFGILGLMTSYEWLRRHALNSPPMRRFAPLAGGAVLLGFLGTSGENTDVVAHVTGLLHGILIGFVLGKTRLPDRISKRAQTMLACATIAVLAGAWLIALN